MADPEKSAREKLADVEIPVPAEDAAVEPAVEADPSPAEEEAAEPAADVDADSSTATEEEEGTGDDALPFGKHPRWKKVQADRDEARARAATAERDREELRRDAERLRNENAQLAHLRELNDRLSRDPEALKRAERIAELTESVGREPEVKDRADAEIRVLRQEIRSIASKNEADKRENERRTRWNAEVHFIAGTLEKEKVPAADREKVGAMIHRNYIGALATGAKVSLDAVAKEVLDYFAARDAAATERVKNGKINQDGKTAAVPTIRPSAGRVTVSNEPEKDASMAIRDKAGRIDVNKSLLAAGKRAYEMTRAKKSARP